MGLFAAIAGGWFIGMIGYGMYKKQIKNTDKIVYYDLSKYEVKYKRINDKNTERAKGTFK